MLATTHSLKKSKLFSLSSNSPIVDIAEEELVISSITSKQPLVSEDTIPWWASTPNILDKQQHKPSDADYDPSSLYIPESEKKKLTPTMFQFWEFKSANFDKIVLFKMGQFYEMFYEDAIIGNKNLNLNWNNKRFSVGFREKTFDQNTAKLLELGYKIAVVEQIETSEEMNTRIKESAKKQPKTLNRQITQILTQGTWNGDFQDHDSKYLLIIYKKFKKIGFCLYESSLLQVLFGSFEDNPEKIQLRTLLWQTNPVEIVYNVECEEFIKIFLSLPKKPVLNKLNEWSYENIFEISQILNEEIIEITLKGLFFYLKKILILDNVRSSLTFEEYKIHDQINRFLVLDHQTLRHLEVFYTNHFTKFSKKGSLFEFLDRTVSGFGHRLLHTWLSNPLNDSISILSRLDAIEDLEFVASIRDFFQQKLKTIPDIERIFVKIYQYLKKVDVITHEDIPSCRLKAFKQLLDYVRLSESLIVDFQSKSNEFHSVHLQRLVTYENQSGLLPHCNEIIEKIMEMIQWNEDEPTPKPGVSEEYDENEKKIKIVEADFDTILSNVKKQFNDLSIVFSHARFPFQLEIKEELVNGLKKPENFEFTSSRAGFQRFYSTII